MISHYSHYFMCSSQKEINREWKKKEHLTGPKPNNDQIHPKNKNTNTKITKPTKLLKKKTPNKQKEM